MQLHKIAEPPRRYDNDVLGESLVIGILGRRGQGKSLLSSYFAWQIHKKGGLVLHNGIFNFGEVINLERLVKLEGLENGLIFLDEVHNYFGRGRSNTTLSFILGAGMLAQLRHKRCWLLYTTQDSFMVNNNLKYQTDIEIQCTRKRGSQTIHGRAFHTGTLAPYGMTAAAFNLRRIEQYYKLYDTSKYIDPIEIVSMDAKEIKEHLKRERPAEIPESEKVFRCIEFMKKNNLNFITNEDIIATIKTMYGVKVHRNVIGRLLKGKIESFIKDGKTHYISKTLIK